VKVGGLIEEGVKAAKKLLDACDQGDGLVP
jgi:hypothetical protein